MPRIRTIKPEFFSHEDLASKSAHARLLAIGLLTLADCEGRLRWVPMQVHAQVFPWEELGKHPGASPGSIEDLLGELIDVGYVLHYEVTGKRYVEIVNFRKHQRLSGKELQYKSRCPQPPSGVAKSSDFQGETGEATGKHLGASPGSIGNPLGTGEHRNIGTGEQCIGILPTDTDSPKQSKAVSVQRSPPSIDDVREYMLRLGYRDDAESFIDFYSANGWVQGRGKPIRDWQAAVRNWQRNDFGKPQQRNKPTTKTFEELGT